MSEERTVWVVECRDRARGKWRIASSVAFFSKKDAQVEVKEWRMNYMAAKYEYRAWPYAAKESA